MEPDGCRYIACFNLAEYLVPFVAKSEELIAEKHCSITILKIQ